MSPRDILPWLALLAPEDVQDLVMTGETKKKQLAHMSTHIQVGTSLYCEHQLVGGGQVGGKDQPWCKGQLSCHGVV